ncbi:ribonuclease H-like domain-containing protein, partial [Schizophyllum amplum]
MQPSHRLIRPLPKRRNRDRRDAPQPLPTPHDPSTGLPVAATPLDTLLANVLRTRESLDDGLHALYGPPCVSVLADGSCSGAMPVWIDGSCINNGRAGARAGAGAYFGEGSPRNTAARVPGRQTNNRGEHLALICALLQVGPATPLIIHCDSELVIRTYCYWARRYEQHGWTCANADLIMHAVDILRRRSSTVQFRWVRGHSGNTGNEAADQLAKSGAA